MRYYFNIRDSAGLTPDDEGSELSGITAARQEARASAMDFAMDDLRGGLRIRERQIEITNAKGEMLESISVRDLVNAYTQVRE